MIKDKIEQTIKSVLQELGLPEEKINLEHPTEYSYGDYSTNIALVLAKNVNKKPRELAETIVEKLKIENLEFVEKIEVAGAGFINFYLSPKFFQESLKEIITENENFGKNKTLEGKKIMVEYTDPNPFKPFHIGHLMSNAIGESISRMIETSGAKMIRACWQGDVGLHVAKAIWGMQEKVKSQKLKVEDATIKEWGYAYVLGAEKYETDESAKKEITTLNKIIFEKSDKDINEMYDSGRQVSLEHFEEIYKKLGTHFDHYFFEGTEGREGIKIVEENLKKGVFEKSDGAVVFKGENYGLHTRVFINSAGLPTYETKELGLNQAKFKTEKDLDKSIIITGNEQNDYFKVLLRVLEIIFPEIGKRTIHIGHGMLQFASGKMSSRKGNVVTGEALIKQVEELVGEKIKSREFNATETEKIKEAVAVGAIKYSVLRQSIGGNIIYDFEKSISFEGDSGPYLQYSYARAVSVLRKAGGETEGKKLKVESVEKPGELERMLYRFPEIVERSANEYEPHYVVTYLTELASAFNSFYANNLILEAGEDTSYRLALVKSFTIVMRNGLNILAIPVLEQM